MDYNMDGTKDYPEAIQTKIIQTRSNPIIPTRPITFFTLQTTQHSNSENISAIPAASMKHVGVCYGGLKGFAYVQSLHEFCKFENQPESPTIKSLSGDPTLKRLVTERADRISKGVYSLENAIRQLASCGTVEVAEPPVDLGSCLELFSEEVILENNSSIISWLSLKRAGRMDHDFDQAEQEMMKRLHTQIVFLANKQNNPALSKLSK